MSENQINVFCKNCNSVIYVGRELTVEEQSDTKDQIVDFVDVIKPADPLVLEIETTIAEMEQYQELFNASKKQLKQQKIVKHRVKAEMKAGKNYIYLIRYI